MKDTKQTTKDATSVTIDTSTTTEQQLNNAIKKIEELQAKLDTVKVKKEVSEVFYNDKKAELMKFTSLSETKKYFETNELALLKKMLELENVESFNSVQFHTALVKYLKVE